MVAEMVAEQMVAVKMGVTMEVEKMVEIAAA